MMDHSDSGAGVTTLERLRILIDRTHEGIFLVAFPRGEIVDFNSSAARITGRAGGALRGMPIEDLVGHHTWAQLVEFVDDTSTDPGIPRVVTADLHTAEGDVVIALSLGYHGFKDGLFGVVTMRDVTAQERAVQELRAAHRRVRDVVEFLPDPTFVVDASGVIVEWNRAMESLTGVSKRVMIGASGRRCGVPIYGRPSWLLVHRVLGFKCSEDVPAYDAVERMADRVEAGVFAQALRGGQGAFVWVAASALRDADGKVIGAIETLRDQTDQLASASALRENERNLRATLDSIRDAVVTTDFSGLVQRMNPAAEMLTGWSLEEAIKRPLSEVAGFLEVTTRQPVQHAEFRAMRITDDHIAHEDLILVRRDASERRVSAKAGPILDDAGEVAGMVVVIRDVTEQRAVERQLALAQKMESIGRLAAGVAHDFNNVLAAIRGYADVLAEDLGPASKFREDVLEIVAATERASNLTRRLLAFSRPDAGEPQPVDVNSLVAGLERMVGRIIGEDIELRMALTATPRCVLADPSQLEQVLLNLVVNSRDAMPLGGVLSITTADLDRSDEEGTTLDKGARCFGIVVSDTGEGMDESTRLRIFEPFFTTKGPERGTGIGLSTTNRIVRELGGSIEVHSRLGQGTSFTIRLPTCECGADRPASASVFPAAGSSQATILVAEDEPVLRRLICRILAKRKYAVLSAADGVEALEVAEQWGDEIDLVITDVVMPRMGGVELQRKLSAKYPRIKTLFVSGYSSDTIVQRGLESDEPGFLAKPFTTGRLVRKVEEQLSGSAK